MRSQANRARPGLAGEDVIIVDSVEELIGSDLAREHPFTSKDIADMQTAEGFYDRKSGKSILITGNIRPLASETVEAAMSRVLLHEHVGHHGMEKLLEGNAAQQQRLSHLITQIPETELQRIAGEPGYSRLQNNPRELALEWLARQVEKQPDILQRKGPAQELWRLMRELVADWQTRMGFQSNIDRSLDSQVGDLLERARDQAAKKRPAIPGVNHPDVGPRLAFSIPIRQVKPASWTGVKPGHRWMSAKKFLPKLNDFRPKAIVSGSFDKMVRDFASHLNSMPAVVKDPLGD